MNIKIKKINTQNIKIILSGFFVSFLIFTFSIQTSHAFTVGIPNNYISLNSGLVAYWTFDGKDIVNGLVKDRSTSGNDGHWVNAATSTYTDQGKIGQGARFDGVDDKISFTSTNYGTTHTISYWIKYTDTGDGMVLSGPTNADFAGYVSGPSASGGIYYSAQNDIANVTHGGLASNSWNYITIVRSGASVSFYKNGAQIGTTQTLGSNLPITLSILGISSTATSPANMVLDDMRIYNRALSTQEIKQIYNLGIGKVGVSTATSSSPLGNGLVGYWTFDGKDIVNGLIKDRSTSGNDGHWVNAATSTYTSRGKIGQGGKFDGIDDYVNVPSSSSLNFGANQDFSLSLWYYVTKNGGNGALISKRAGSGAGYIIYYNSISSSANVIMVNSANTIFGLTNTDIGLVPNSWNLITATFSRSGNLTLYKNGVLFNQASISSGAADDLSNATALQIGEWVSAGRPFGGTLDDVRVYNRVLTPQEVKQIYNLGASNKIGVSPTASSSPLASSLVGYWTFDGKDMISGLIQDKSGNGNDGHWINAATSTTNVQGKIGQGGRFDGINDYVDCGTNTAVLPDVFTFSAWIKNNNFSASATFLGLGNNTHPLLQFSSNGNRPLGQLAANNYRYWSATSPTNIVNSNWHHYVWVVTGNTINDINNSVLYVDGRAQDVFATVNSEAPGTKSRCKLGGQHTAGTINPFNGTLDDVRMYNRALSAQEALELYNLGR